jgi:hypothetical protein
MQKFGRGPEPPVPTARCPRLYNILHRKHWERIKLIRFPQIHTRQEKREMATLAARREMRGIASGNTLRRVKTNG